MEANFKLQLKRTTLTATSMAKWDDHAKYEGSINLTSEKGVGYLGFVLKGTNRVALRRSDVSGLKFIGYAELPEGVEFETPAPKATLGAAIQNGEPSRPVLFRNAVLEKFGIKTEVKEVDNGLLIKTQSVQGAQTLLRALRRHRIQLRTTGYRHCEIFLPVAAEQVLGNYPEISQKRVWIY